MIVAGIMVSRWTYMCLSVNRPSFLDDNLCKNDVFSSNLVCALILWRYFWGLLMGKFRGFLTELSAHRTSIFSFLDDNLSKCQ